MNSNEHSVVAPVGTALGSDSLVAADYQKHARHDWIVVYELVYLLSGKEPPPHWKNFRVRYVDNPDPSAPMFEEFTETYRTLKAGMDSGKLKWSNVGWYGLRRIESQELVRWSQETGKVVIPPELLALLPAPKPAETPGERRERMRQRKEQLIAANVKPWQPQLAKEFGVSPQRVRQMLDDKPKAAKHDDDEYGLGAALAKMHARPSAKGNRKKVTRTR